MHLSETQWNHIPFGVGFRFSDLCEFTKKSLSLIFNIFIIIVASKIRDKLFRVEYLSVLLCMNWAEHFRLFDKIFAPIMKPRKDWPFNQKDWPFYLQWPPNPWQIAAPSIPRLNISDFRVSPDLTAAWSNFSRSQSEKTTAGPSFITPPPPLTSSWRSWTLKTSALACLTLPL